MNWLVTLNEKIFGKSVEINANDQQFLKEISTRTSLRKVAVLELLDAATAVLEELEVLNTTLKRERLRLAIQRMHLLKGNDK